MEQVQEAEEKVGDITNSLEYQYKIRSLKALIVII